MKLPKLDDLVGEQIAIYEMPADTPLFVVGPPGSGKTSLAVLRCNHLNQLKTDCSVVTRNRMLAALSSQLGAPTSTMHELVSKDYWDTFSRKISEDHGYIYDWTRLAESYKSKDLQPKREHLIVDEGQNLPKGFFSWVLQHGAESATVFADEDQTTDSQRATLPDICAAGFPNPIRLTKNHRNTAQIAALAEHFHKSAVLAPGVVPASRTGEKPRLHECTSLSEFSDQVALRYKNRGGSIGVILCSVQDVQTMYSLLQTRVPDGARLDYYTSANPNLSRSTQVLQPGITVLTSESVIGLEFDTVYLQDLARSLPCSTLDDYRRMYMLCARARQSLMLVNGPSPLSAAQLASLPGPAILDR